MYNSEVCCAVGLILVISIAIFAEITCFVFIIFFNLSLYAAILVFDRDFLTDQDSAGPQNPVYMVSPTINCQPASNLNLNNLVWPKLKGIGGPSLSTEWQEHPRPVELDLLPDGDDTPHELIELILRTSDKPTSPTQNPIPFHQPFRDSGVDVSPSSPHHSDQAEISGCISRVAVSLPPEPADEAACTSRFLATEDGYTTHQRPRRQKLRIRTSFNSSIHDLMWNTAPKLHQSAVKTVFSRSPRSSLLKEPEQPQVAECASCLDDFILSNITSLNCQHSYCRPCLGTLVKTAMQTESQFPPKCCLIEIPLQTVLLPLDRTQRDAYKDKAAEWSQPADKRWYCPNTTCAKWISPSKLSHTSPALTVHKCPYCKTKICRTCRGVAHAAGTECPQDFGLEATLEEAERAGWRRCYRCQAMVEKTAGCRHITCKCKAEFCYTCGAVWRTCACTEVDQARRDRALLERRQAIDATAREEEEEMARAIAEVEAFELREAEERRQREEEERRREEEELARLEEDRLATEALRRAEEEEAERRAQEVIKDSIEERMVFLRHAFQRLVEHQQSTLNSRHDSEQTQIGRSADQLHTENLQRYDTMKTKMFANISRRAQVQTQAISATTSAMVARHEAENAENARHIQLHHTGKPEQAAHVQHLLNWMQNEHSLERGALQEKQRVELKALRENAEREAKGLEYNLRHQTEQIKKDKHAQIVNHGKTVHADRMWFSTVTKRRAELFEDLRTTMVTEAGLPWCPSPEAVADNVPKAVEESDSRSSSTYSKFRYIPRYQEPESGKTATAPPEPEPEPERSSARPPPPESYAASKEFAEILREIENRNGRKRSKSDVLVPRGLFGFRRRAIGRVNERER